MWYPALNKGKMTLIFEELGVEGGEKVFAAE